MNHENNFSVSRFKNRNGVVSWRVSGWLHGIRIRKNFKTKEEAAAEKAALELKGLQMTAGMRATMTFLSDKQLRHAEDAFRRLADRTRSLAFYLDYALANYHEPQNQKKLSEAVADYVAEKTKQHERALISDLQLRDIKNGLKCLEKRFSGVEMQQIIPAALLPHLERGNPSLKTYNNRRGILSTFFKFAVQKEWVAANPVEKTPHHRINHRRGSAKTLTARAAAELMADVEQFHAGMLVPYLRYVCSRAFALYSVRRNIQVKVRSGALRYWRNSYRA